MELLVTRSSKHIYGKTLAAAEHPGRETVLFPIRYFFSGTNSASGGLELNSISPCAGTAAFTSSSHSPALMPGMAQEETRLACRFPEQLAVPVFWGKSKPLLGCKQSRRQGAQWELTAHLLNNTALYCHFLSCSFFCNKTRGTAALSSVSSCGLFLT